MATLLLDDDPSLGQASKSFDSDTPCEEQLKVSLFLLSPSKVALRFASTVDSSIISGDSGSLPGVFRARVLRIANNVPSAVERNSE